MVLTPEFAPGLPGGFVKILISGLHSGVSVRFCISNKFLADADGARQGITHEVSYLKGKSLLDRHLQDRHTSSLVPPNTKAFPPPGEGVY